MDVSLLPPKKTTIVYPESDGKPMADNTIQYRWIRRLEGNVSVLFQDNPNVFVAGDLLWYPVEGFPEIVNAPDVMVVFGRPRHDRGSYKQWEEEGIAPQVVFEVLSPSNDYNEMMDKQVWYAEHGVQEYYVYNPDKNTLVAHVLEHDWLRPIRVSKEYVSPLLKIRFDLSGPEMAVLYPDGRRFLTFQELEVERKREQQLRLDAEKRADRLAELSRKLLAGQASDEEKQELARLAAPTT